MIYVHEISVPAKELWGGVVGSDFVVPQGMRRIRGVLAVVTPGDNAILRRLMTSYFDYEQGKTVTELQNVESTQIGVVSLSLKDSNVLLSGTPAIVATELTNGSYHKNLVRFEPQSVESGSLLRVTMEEKDSTPFLTQSEYDALSSDIKDQYGALVDIDSAYNVKVYLDYD